MSTPKHEQPVPPDAIKVIVAYRRASGSTAAAFREGQSRDGAAAQAAALPGVLRYVRSLTTPSGYRKKDPVYDAVDEAWFADERAARGALDSPAFGTLRDGLGADPASVAVFVVRDHLIKDGTVREGALKNFEFVTRRPDLSVEEFRRYWREHHGPLAAGIGAIRRYVQSHAIDSEYEDREPDWEGSAITWFDDIEGMRESGASPILDATRADEENFLGAPLQLPFIITTEQVLVG